MSHTKGQQHPISVYLWIWGLLFVLSFFSYMVDYLNFEGLLRWTLILLFMFAKAGLILAVFMHMAWERLALLYTVVTPPSILLLFVIFMLVESNYIQATRQIFFATGG